LYLYFTTLKSHFSILTTHFYKTTPIPFSILQYITLKYYKIIPFFIYFFSHPNQTHGSRSAATPHNPHTHAGKPKPTTTIPTPANPNPPQPILSATTAEKGERNQIRKPHHCRQTQTQTPSPPANPNRNPITAANHHHQQIWKQPITENHQPTTTSTEPLTTHNHLHRAVNNPQPPPPPPSC
jgi:hypothetical protein